MGPSIIVLKDKDRDKPLDGSGVAVTILGPNFHFCPLPSFPDHLTYHLIPSHAIPRSTTYPPGLPRHPQAHWLPHSLLFYVISPTESLLRILFLAMTHSYLWLTLTPLISDSPMTPFWLITIRHYCGSPIILLFSQLGIGTSHLYIRPAISLELGLKPNLVFNPRLVASPVSLLRVPLSPSSRFKAPFEALPFTA